MTAAVVLQLLPLVMDDGHDGDEHILEVGVPLMSTVMRIKKTPL